jgi:drug/metabolite transporter (DMT)-like permease
VESYVFIAVLCAAACHAGWNALVKVGFDPLSATTSIAIAAAALSLLGLPFAGMPAVQVWPWFAASAIIHLLYFAALIESYRTGDLGQVYPIARGSAPLMTAIVGAVFIGEQLNLLGWSGIVTLAAGVLLMSTGGWQKPQPGRRSVGYALLTAVTICGYSVTDGIGVRLSKNPPGYVLLLFVVNAMVLLSYGLWRDRNSLMLAMRRLSLRGFAGGALQVLSYGIVLWAMTIAPIAIVASLRESSVLFSVIIATLGLKEPLRTGRIAAAALILMGLVLLRLQ